MDLTAAEGVVQQTKVNGFAVVVAADDGGGESGGGLRVVAVKAVDAKAVE